MPKTLAPTLRPLSETEIHDALYGEIHGRRRPIRDGSPMSENRPSEEPSWTGQEILQQELKRLSRELTVLRQEREQLAERLTRRPTPVAPPPAPVTAVLQPMPTRIPAPIGRFWAVVGALLVASAAAAVLFHSVVLEAQMPRLTPSVGDLYSVQVGVYDVKSLAQRFVDELGKAGHPAFLAEGRSARGKPRYRVYVGRYASRPEAEQQLARLHQHPLLKDSFVLKRR